MLNLFKIDVKAADIIVKRLGGVGQHVVGYLPQEALILPFFLLVAFFENFLEEVMDIHALVHVQEKCHFFVLFKV